MARSEKKSRRLVVDSATFLWKVGHRHERENGPAQGCREVLALRPLDGRGRLEIVFLGGPGRAPPVRCSTRPWPPTAGTPTTSCPGWSTAGPFSTRCPPAVPRTALSRRRAQTSGRTDLGQGRFVPCRRTSAAPVRGLLRYDHQERVLFQVHHDLRRHALAPTGGSELLRGPTAPWAPGGELLKYGATHGPPPVVRSAVRSNDGPAVAVTAGRRPGGRRPRTGRRRPAAVHCCVRAASSPQSCFHGRVLRASHWGLRKRGNRDRLDQRCVRRGQDRRRA